MNRKKHLSNLHASHVRQYPTVEELKLLEPLPKIGDVKCKCLSCGWEGCVNDCEPDVDGDGSLECPKCRTVVEIEV